MKKAIKDRDCCREIDDTLMEDIEEMSSVQESELTALRVELDRRGPAPPGIKAECALLISQVVRFEGRACSPYLEICCSESHLG